MALQTISEMLEFNDHARQFLNFLHRQRVASSSSIEGAREFLKSAREWSCGGDLPPPKIDLLPVLYSLPLRINGSAAPRLHRNKLHEKAATE